MKTGFEVQVDGKRLQLSNLEKALYPVAGFTKARVIDYYTRIAPVLLPHLRGRPLTLKRYPDGVSGEFFYEKECPSHRPQWMPTAAIPGDRTGRVVNYCLCENLAALVWVANLASLELHTSLSPAPEMGRPTTLVFDLDPGEPAGILECAEVGFRLKEILDQLGLAGFPKTSGSKGLQVYVPLNTPVTYDETKTWARAVAALLQKRRPEQVVSSMRKVLRAGKVLVDWSQNDVHKTTVCVYSLRAMERPTVSTPVGWDEVEGALRAGDAGRLVFEAESVLERVERLGDLFAPVLELRQELPLLGATGAR